MIKSGLSFDFIMMIVLSAVGLYGTWRTRTGKAPGIKRQIPALEGVKEGVGVCAELGKAMHFGSGPGSLQTKAGSEIIAAMAILDYTARLCARSDVPIYSSVWSASSHPYTQQVLRQAYTAEGKIELLPIDAVRYFGEADTSYGYGIIRTLHDENCGANFLIGAWDASTSISSEEAFRMGLFQVGGAALHFKGALPFFVATCEYTFICEELYAAGAMLTNDSDMLGTLYGVDIVRWILIGLIIVGTLFATTGSSYLINLLGM